MAAPVLTSYEKKTKQELNRLKATHQTAADKRALKQRIAEKAALRDAEMAEFDKKALAEARARYAAEDAAATPLKPSTSFQDDLAAKLTARGLKIVNGQVVPE